MTGLPARLNWGCEERPTYGWVNSDIRALPGADRPRESLFVEGTAP